MEQQIQITNVCKSYGPQNVLHNISLIIRKAEIFGLLGPSGAGKTTLIKSIAGIDQATSGTIEIFGDPVPSFRVMGNIGYMNQSDALYEELTAQENLDFFATVYGLKGERKKQRMTETMRLVKLQDSMKKRVGEFSGGMKRRLSLAITLLHEPQLLILDEPTVGMDPVLRQSIWDELGRLCEKGITIIVTTHVMDEADKCHRLGMIREGKLIAVGTPEELKENSNASSIEEVFIHYGGVQQ